jgi:hypothetical protein
VTSVGAGYLLRDKAATLGLGPNWSRPSEKSFGLALRDQYTVEIYHRVQVLTVHAVHEIKMRNMTTAISRGNSRLVNTDRAPCDPEP